MNKKYIIPVSAVIAVVILFITIGVYFYPQNSKPEKRRISDQGNAPLTTSTPQHEAQANTQNPQENQNTMAHFIKKDGQAFYTYFNQQKNTPVEKPLEGADAHTFTVLGKHYAKDKNSVWIYITGEHAEKLPKADSASFHILRESESPRAKIAWSRDKTHIYYNAYILPGADPSTFKLLKNPSKRVADLAKDNITVYKIYWNANDGPRYEMATFQDADPETFEILDEVYAKDAHHVWNYRDDNSPSLVTIVSAPQSFAPLPHHYYEYRSHIYHYDWNKKLSGDSAYPVVQLTKIPNADRDSFEVLNGTFAKDVNHVYAQEYGAHSLYIGSHSTTLLLAGADSSTFQILQGNFAKDKSYVWHYSELGKPQAMEADAGSFTVLNNSYAKDADNVWYYKRGGGLQKLSQVDPKTFQALKGKDAQGPISVAKDKNHVYKNGHIAQGVSPVNFNVRNFLEEKSTPTPSPDKEKHFQVSQGIVHFAGTKLASADPKTFMVMNDDFAKDAAHVWYYQTRFRNDDIKLLPSAHPASFEILNPRLAKDKNSVWYFFPTYDISQSIVRINSADPASFTDLSDIYAKDKSHVWALSSLSQEPRVTIALGADVPSFEVTGPSNSPYAKDKNRVFLYGKRQSGMDTKTFQGLKNNYAKDKNQVYHAAYDPQTWAYKSHTLPQADPTTFKVLTTFYTKDKNHVWYSDSAPIPTIIKQADSASFTPLNPQANSTLYNPPYAKDKNHVFRNSTLIEGADPDTFQVDLPNDSYHVFSKDAFHVYHGTDIIKGRDPKTFQVIFGGNGKDCMTHGSITTDKNGVYYNDKKYEGHPDIKTLRPIGLGYSVDKNHVWFKNALEADLDADTFTPWCPMG